MTTKQKTLHNPQGLLDMEQSVAQHLRAYPDFFDAHPQLLAEMTLHHDTGRAISLIERQVGALRDQNAQLKRQLQGLVQIARDNDRLIERMHRLAVELLDVTSLSGALLILQESLHNDFQADVTAVRLLGTPLPGDCGESREGSAMDMPVVWVERDDTQLSAFKKVMSSGRPLCGNLKMGQTTYLFGELAPRVASGALIPLGRENAKENQQCVGLIAIGAFDEGRFHAGMGTLFLTQMGDLCTRVVRRYLAA